MSLSHSFRRALAVVLAIGLLASPVVAVSVSSNNVPDEARVGEKVQATYTLSELYSDYDSWQLEGRTELRNVTWTVTAYDNTNSKIEQESYDGKSFAHPIDAGDGTVEVRVRVTGTAPDIRTYSYDPPQSFQFAHLSQARSGGESSDLESVSIHHYTNASAKARDAIDTANETITQAKANGADVSEARSTYRDAIEAYEGENFNLAQKLATDAHDSARQASQAKEQRNTMLLIAAGIAVVLIIAGIIYWYLNNRQTYDKLG